MEDEGDSPLSPVGAAILEAYAARRQRSSSAWLNVPPGCPFWPLLWLLPFFLAGDCALAPLSVFDDSSVPQDFPSAAALITSAVCAGMVAVQALLLCIYIVFSPEPYWKRLTLFTVAVSVLGGAGLVGMYLLYVWQDWYIGLEDIALATRFVCALPTITIVMQVPFWLLRFSFDWQFVRGTPAQTGDYEVKHRPTTWIDLLIAVVVGALCLTCLLLAPESETLYDPPLWLIAAMMSVMASVAALILGVPLILLFTHMKQRWAWSLALGVPLLIGFFGFAFAAMTMPRHEFEESALLGTGMFTSLFLTLIVGTAGGIRLWRVFGWTIQQVRTFDDI